MLGRSTDRNRATGRRLWFRHVVGGDDTGRKETQLGVPLIPGRAAARSQPTRWSGGRSDAFDPPLLAGVAATVVLAVAVVMGVIPMPAAAAVGLLVPAAVIDVDERRLPDALVAGALAALIATLAIGTAIGRPGDVNHTIFSMVAGAIAMALPVLALHLVSPASMGFGDVKAAAVLGAAVGTVDWRLGAVALCIAALCGATIGVVTRRRTIAFGPFLVFGAWCVLLVHDQILTSLFTGGVET